MRPTGVVEGGPARTAVLEGGPCDGQELQVPGPIPDEYLEVADVPEGGLYARQWTLSADLTRWRFTHCPEP